MVDQEFDFPRTQRKRPINDQNGEGEEDEKRAKKGLVRKKADTKNRSKKPSNKGRETSRDEFGGVWATRLTPDDLTEGVFGLGVVDEIHDTKVILKTAFNLSVSLPAANIGSKFVERAKKGEITLDDIVGIGQILSFRVVKKQKRAEGKLRKKTELPVVSCSPSSVNQHIVSARLVPGLVLAANVTSIEEKGIICDIGISGYSGFIGGAAILQEGQPIMVRVENVKSRIVNVSLHVEGENLSDETIDELQLNYLTPGTILYAEPEKHTPHGVYVNLGNGVRGFLASKFLPPRLRIDPSKLVKALRVIVMLCQQNSKLLILSAHPDIIAVSKPEKRTSFQNIQIGDIISCRVAAVNPKTIFMALPDDEYGKQSLLSVVAGRKFLEHDDKIEEKYSINSEHLCRVTGFNMVERTIFVSTKKEILNQQMISYKDAQVGALVEGTVVSYTRIGLFVKIFGTINGFVPLKWATERVVKDLEKIFPIGKNIRLRVLSIDLEHKNLVLTSRQKLIDYKGTIVTKACKEVEGKSTIGLVATILEHGSALIVFFNGISGYMPAEQVKRLGPEGSIREGSIVEVSIAHYDVEKNRILVHGPNSSATERREKAKAKKEKAIRVKLFGIYKGKVLGTWKPIDSHEKGIFGVEILLPNNKIGRLHVSELPGEYLVEGTNPVEQFLSKMKGKSVDVKVIGLFRKKEKTPDLTLQKSKLTETKRKQKLIGFKAEYKTGDLIPVFSFGGGESAAQRKFEVNPLFSAVLPRQKLPSTKLITDPNSTSKLVDVDFIEGEMRLARVLGVNSKTRVLDITFTENERVKIGDTVPGRVLNVTSNPSGILFQLSNGQLAYLGPTSFTGLYKKAQAALRTFATGELHNIVVASEAAPFAPKQQKWEVVMVKRWNQRKSGVKNRLFTSISDVQCNDAVQGFVISQNPCIVELGAGVQAAIEDSSFEAKINDLVLVRIKGIDELKKMLCGQIVEIVQCCIPEETKETKNELTLMKRKSSEVAGFEALEPEVQLEMKTRPVKKKLADPGWEFSSVDFSTDNLAKIAKLADDVDESKVTKQDEKADNKPRDHDESPKKKKTKIESIIDVEKELIAAESRIIEGNMPENENEFGIMLQRNPNSAQLWIRYMSYFLGKNDLSTARNTAKRALKNINYREETERLAMWTAYLNMEVAFGSADSWKPVFEEACANADSFKIHKQTASILTNNDKNEEADEIYNQLIKRFRKLNDEVWILYATFLMSTKRFDDAREVLKKALSSVPNAGHVSLISRFATLEFDKGDTERGRTLFESVLSNFPKKVDVWNVYLDLSIKHDSHEAVRSLFDRICSLPLTNHKLRPFYKKWAEYEAKHGDEKTQNEVRERAVKLLRLV